jgi:hypothetical protein
MGPRCRHWWLDARRAYLRPGRQPAIAGVFALATQQTRVIVAANRLAENEAPLVPAKRRIILQGEQISRLAGIIDVSRLSFGQSLELPLPSLRALGGKEIDRSAIYFTDRKRQLPIFDRIRREIWKEDPPATVNWSQGAEVEIEAIALVTE